MKIKCLNLKAFALAAMIAGFGGFAIADGQDADMAAAAQQSAALEAVATNRSGTIDGIVAIWEPVVAEMGDDVEKWKTRFIPALEAASDTQLLDIQSASSYDGIRAILQGRDEPISLDGVVGSEGLGSLSSDLVFTPMVPCRFFDTRAGTGSYLGPFGGNPGTVRNYQSWGLTATQGGSASGCTPPDGTDFVALAANFTVVPLGKGHIRVWPYLAPQPNASFLNYNSTVNSNLANAGIVATCYLCGFEVSVSTWFGSSHSLADAMGYFYPANVDSGNGTDFNSQTLVSGDNYIMQPSFTASTTGRCMVVSSMDVNTSTADTYSNTFIRTARSVGAGSPVNDGQRGHYSIPAGTSRSSSVTISQVYNVTGGTSYAFGCYAFTGGDFVGNSAYCRTQWMCL